MFFIYSLLLTVVFVLLSPLFLLRKKKYSEGFNQRLGNIPLLERGEKPVIWVHCVSVGETNAAKPLIDEITKKYPLYRLVISTTTRTGQELARKIYKDQAALIFYFPFDWKFAVRRALEKINPAIILIMETELWFNFFREAGLRKAQIFIINGRISEKSFRRYNKIKKFLSQIFPFIQAAFLQTKDDAERLIKLGMERNKTQVTGNIKFDQKALESENLLTESFRHRFGFSKDTALIVAASTHSPEEELILKAFKKVTFTTKENSPRLLIAPRHPERFEEVVALIDQTGLKWARQSSSPNLDDRQTQIVLLDSIGELRAVYPLSRIVFVGGSLIPHGGQNILEPAIEKNAIITGFFTMNFAEIVRIFSEQKALIQIPNLHHTEIVGKLAENFQMILENTEIWNELSENAYKIIEENRGATKKTMEFLTPFLVAKSDKTEKD